MTVRREPSAWADCGTIRAYHRHYRHRQRPCDRCVEASHADYRRRRDAGRSPRELAPCGTAGAYRRHLRSGERPCVSCTAADREYRARLKGWEASALSASHRDTRNNLPETPGYRYRARTYPWAVAVLARAEDVWGRPEDEEAA